MDQKFYVVAAKPGTSMTDIAINGLIVSEEEWIRGAEIAPTNGELIPVFDHTDKPLFLHGLYSIYTPIIFQVEVTGELHEYRIPKLPRQEHIDKTVYLGRRMLTESVRIVRILSGNEILSLAKKFSDNLRRGRA
jgi:hypothetical protein